jgi:hypothetical protein
VFAPQVEYLLVLATPVRVFLVGVTFHGTATGPRRHGQELSLEPDALYVSPTDNVEFKAIVGTDNGRIFLGGADGGLLVEVVGVFFSMLNLLIHLLFFYVIIIILGMKSCMNAKMAGFTTSAAKSATQARRLLFLFRPSCARLLRTHTIISQPTHFFPCRYRASESIEQLVVDNRRQFLYTRAASANNTTVTIYHFDAGRNLTLFGSLPCDAAAGNGRIISITPVIAEPGERDNFNVVAITDKGIRMYVVTGVCVCVLFCFLFF